MQQTNVQKTVYVRKTYPQTIDLNRLGVLEYLRHRWKIDWAVSTRNNAKYHGKLDEINE